jgi:hypothetical protein
VFHLRIEEVRFKKLLLKFQKRAEELRRTGRHQLVVLESLNDSKRPSILSVSSRLFSHLVHVDLLFFLANLFQN